MVKFTPAGSRRLRPISRDPYRSTQRSFREEMDVASNNSIHLQRLLDRLKQGDDAARNELIGAAYERLRLLARKLLHHDFPRLRHDTDTILDETVLRLFKALRECQPAGVRLHLSTRPMGRRCAPFGPSSTVGSKHCRRRSGRWLISTGIKGWLRAKPPNSSGRLRKPSAGSGSRPG